MSNIYTLGLNPKQASWLMTTHMFPFLLVAFCTCRESYDLASPNWKELQRWENNYIVIMESRHMCLTWRSATAWKTRDVVSPTHQTIIHLNVILMMDNFMSLHNQRSKLISANKLNQQELSNKELWRNWNHQGFARRVLYMTRIKISNYSGTSVTYYPSQLKLSSKVTHNMHISLV